MEFLYVFALTVAALCCFFAYASLIAWVAMKARDTGKLRYKIAVFISIVFSISFIIAGLVVI